INFSAPAACAANKELNPTPPKPITAAESPARISVLFNTAPAPVKIAQPNNAAILGDKDLGTFTHEATDTTAYSATQDTPVWWFKNSLFLDKRFSPLNKVPLAFAFPPGSHRACLLAMHEGQLPQDGTKTKTT